jgi:pimeloyl-ACP methyl ester carboxylesterase
VSGGVRRRRAVVDGIGTVVRSAGDDAATEAVAFVHGNPNSGEDWVDLAPAVAPFGRAVAWDQPGFGEADRPAGFAHTVAAHGAFVGAALDALRVERAHLVLHDLGGPWGLTWAAANPARVASVTLIDTGVLRGYGWHAMARIWRTPLLGEAVNALMIRPAFDLALRRGNPTGLPRALRDRMWRDADPAMRRAVLAVYRQMDLGGDVARDLHAALAPLDLPALVVWGAHDPYLPASWAPRQRETFPSARIEVLPDSGHWPYADDPEAVADLVVPFLRERLDA